MTAKNNVIDNGHNGGGRDDNGGSGSVGGVTAQQRGGGGCGGGGARKIGVNGKTVKIRALPLNIWGFFTISFVSIAWWC